MCSPWGAAVEGWLEEDMERGECSGSRTCKKLGHTLIHFSRSFQEEFDSELPLEK